MARWDGLAEEMAAVGVARGTAPSPTLWLWVAGRLAAGSALTQTGFASLAVSLNEFLLSRLLFLASGCLCGFPSLARDTNIARWPRPPGDGHL